ncbi:MAG: hypothetical protein AB1679_30720 [Actinomycetota bacterium]
MRRSARGRVCAGDGARSWAWRSCLGLILAIVALSSGISSASADPGTVDVSFGVDGALRTNLGGTYDWAYATAIQPDGRILAAGVSEAKGTYDFAVARYTSTKDLDPTFGKDGVVLTDFEGSYDWAYALALLPNGKILVAGVSDASGSKDFALARYNPDGTLDPSFGRGGLVTANSRSLTADIIRGMAVQPDGRIVVAGVTYEDVATVGPNGDFMVARFLPDGQDDLTFGIGGVMTTDFGDSSYDEPYAVVLQPDGKIVLGGYTNAGNGPGVLFGADQLALARYGPSGLLDPAFGQGGKVVFDGGSLDERILALALARDGSLVAGGYVNGERRSDLLLARLRTDGTLNKDFGNTGKGFSVNDLGTHSERIASLVLQPDGKIVAGGQTAVAHHADFAVFRYDGQGFFDPTFGRAGVTSFDFQGREDRVHDLALQPDGKIVAVGQSEADFAVARFNAS